MKFEYEISRDEYADAQILYCRLSTGSNNFKRGAPWVLAGVFCIFMPWYEGIRNWATMLLAAIGAWWLYAGLTNLFPGTYLRRQYLTAGMSGKKYQAEVDENGFEVTGDVCSWHARWPAVSVKGENKHIFMLFAANTVFIFAKKYLTAEQQDELRRFAALPPPSQD
jgi:hypothetical protein